MEIRPLQGEDIDSIWRINQDGLPGTGEVSKEGISELLNLSEHSIGVYDGKELLGFVMCLLPRTEYGSINYAWFNQRYEQFLYVDRVAVSKDHRNNQIGTLLYEKVMNWSEQLKIPVAAEVSLEPPNPGSMRFHYRHGFSEVGVLHQENKSVTMMLCIDNI